MMLKLQMISDSHMATDAARCSAGIETVDEDAVKMVKIT